MSLVMAVIFWIVALFVPSRIWDIPIPGLEKPVTAGFLVWAIATLITAIFLIRALADAMVLGDILTDIFLKRLGIKEERSPKRAARDGIYIIVIILLTTAISPFIATIADVGATLQTVVTYIALGMILVLIYDIGRILYRIAERRAESIAKRLAKMADTHARRKRSK